MRRFRWKRIGHQRHFSSSHSRVGGDCARSTGRAMGRRAAGLAAFGVGVVAGAVGSTLGIGGGLLLIPVLTGSRFGLSQLHAHGTAQFANFSTMAAGSLSYAHDGCVVLTLAAACGVSATVMTGVGVKLASSVSERVLKLVFSTGLMALAPLVSLKPYLLRDRSSAGPATAATAGAATGSAPDSSAGSGGVTPAVIPMEQVPRFLLLGGCVGLASGMAGFGAGTLLTTALALGADNVLYPGHHMTQQMAVGTSLAALAVPNAVGALTHWRLGNVRPVLVPGLVLGTACGALLGSRVALDTKESWLRAAFSLILFSVGARSFVKLRRR